MPARSEIDGIEGLTGFLKEVARLTSVRTALQLACEFGGLHPIYIPLNPRSSSPLAVCIGLAEAQTLAREFGGTHQEIPRFRGPAKKPAIALAEGSYAEIARRFNCTVRYVRRVKNGSNEDPRQGSLFQQD